MNDRAVAFAFSALVASSMAQAQQFQKFVGVPGPVIESPYAVLVPDPVTPSFVTVGERFDFLQQLPSRQMVSLHDSTGAQIWSFDFDWGTNSQPALDAERLPQGDLIIAGVARKDNNAAPGLDPVNRVSLMRLDPNGAAIWANRYPGGSLPAGNSFNIQGHNRQVGIALAPPIELTSRGEELVPDIVLASLWRATFTDPILGQFMRVSADGTLLSIRRYDATAALGGSAMVLFDIAPIQLDTGATAFFLAGRVFDRTNLAPFEFLSTPLLILADQFGDPFVAFQYLIFPLPGGSSLNESTFTSVAVSPSGGIYLAGMTDYLVGSTRDLFVMHVGGFLNVVWAKVFEGLEPSERTLVFDSNGDVVVSATYREPGPLFIQDPVLVVLDDATGATQILQRYKPSGNVMARDVAANASGGWNLLGRGRSESPVELFSRGGDGEPGSDIYLAGTDSLGATGCHEEPLQVPISDISIVERPVELTTTIPNKDPQQVFLAVAPQQMVAQDDCPNVRCLCFGDANGDFVTNFNDINAVLGNWLANYGAGETGLGDANCDSAVNFADINTVLGMWLNSCIGAG